MKRLLGLHRQPLFADNWILRYDSWLLPTNESFNNHLEEGKMPYLYYISVNVISVEFIFYLTYFELDP